MSGPDRRLELETIQSAVTDTHYEVTKCLTLAAESHSMGPAELPAEPPTPTPRPILKQRTRWI